MCNELREDSVKGETGIYWPTERSCDGESTAAGASASARRLCNSRLTSSSISSRFNLLFAPTVCDLAYMEALQAQDLFAHTRTITNKKVFVAGGSKGFNSYKGASAVHCTLKSSSGLLYPTAKTLVFLHKPTIRSLRMTENRGRISPAAPSPPKPNQTQSVANVRFDHSAGVDGRLFRAAASNIL